MFADKVEIEVRAGKGGDGKVSFRHEKYRPRGGPDGGDGGNGGSVILAVDHNLNTLVDFRRQRIIEAENGTVGGGNRKHGKAGQDAIVAVPPGTQVWEGKTQLADLTAESQNFAVASGGRGGFGNAHFAASMRQSPRLAELGEPGEVKNLTLELKLLAEVGLIGLPNAGKSTLLSVISHAKPEIADYPFTTLAPNLGVVDFRRRSFVAADIPGLIEGANTGKGLGHDFLRHIERTNVLMHLIDAASPHVVTDLKTIDTELKLHRASLSKKPQIIALSKIDTVSEDEVKQKLKSLRRATRRPVLAISASAHRGLDELLQAAVELIEQAGRVAAKVEQPAVPVIGVEDFPDLWAVKRRRGYFEVTGGKIESFAARTNFEEIEAVERLRDIMRRMGISRELDRLGAPIGAKIKIGTKELEW